MKSLSPLALLCLSVLALMPLSAADTKPGRAAAEKPAATASLAGEYTGTWKGRDESTGALRIKLKPEGATAWVAEAWFTFEGNEVATKLKSIEVAGAKLEMVFAWEVQGTAAQSKLSGTWAGDVLEGKYESTTHEGAASGTWKVTRR